MFSEQERRSCIRHAATFLEENADPTLYGIDLASLADATTPVLLTGGAASPPLFEPVLECLAATLPHVKRHRFDGAGHVPQLTHAHEYVEVVTHFACAQHGAEDVSTAGR